MYQPTEFKDGDNIIIVNDIPYYRYTGVTYKDKLKNGLSLDYVFQLEDAIYNEDPLVDEEIDSDKNDGPNCTDIMVDYEDYYDFYEQNEFQTIPLARKGKWVSLKKRNARNLKKNSIRQNGYTDKLFTIEQHLSDISETNDINDDVYDNVYDYDDDDDFSELSCNCYYCRLY